MPTFTSDTFTDTAGTLLEAHVGAVGATWTQHTLNNPSSSVMISAAGRTYVNGAIGGAYYTSGVPSSADYSVQVDVVLLTDNNASASGVAGRMSTSAQTMYMARWSTAADVWQLYSFVANTPVLLQTDSTHAPSAGGAAVVLKLEMVGTAIKVYADGVQIMSVTNSAVTAAGQAGLYHTGTASATVGVHFDNFVGVDGLGAPINTGAPVVSGTTAVGATLTCTDGTYSPAATSVAKAWRSAGVAITGPAETGNSYVVRAGDAGLAIDCLVTPSNASGAGAATASNAVTIASGFVASDIRFYLSAGGGIGGSPGALIVNPTDVFDAVSNTEAGAGDVEYRAIYIKNTHSVQSSTLTVIWISAQTSSATTSLDIGLAPEAIGADVTAVANENTAPISVTFTAPSSLGAALSIGTLAPGQTKGVWLRRTVLAGTVPVGSDTCQLAHSETGV